MLSTSAKPFDDPGCVFEVKWDGIRALASVDSEGLRLSGREGTDYSGRYPELEILRRLPAGTMLDGELVAIRAGQADFLALIFVVGALTHTWELRDLPIPAILCKESRA